ncbi:hypothetical protein ACLOJK_018367 [Asimina triloba]
MDEMGSNAKSKRARIHENDWRWKREISMDKGKPGNPASRTENPKMQMQAIPKPSVHFFQLAGQ